jgi:hypothetical protein
MPAQGEPTVSNRIKLSVGALAAVCLTSALALHLRAADEQLAAASSPKERFFEMRTYYAAEGKIDALNARFRNHTNKLFQKHGIDLVGYWQRTDNKDVLVYILAYPSREAREQSWKDFMADTDWQKAQKESERDGKLVAKVESAYMTPTDYSPIK